MIRVVKTLFSLGFVRSGSTVFRDIDTLTVFDENCIGYDDEGKQKHCVF